MKWASIKKRFGSTKAKRRRNAQFAALGLLVIGGTVGHMLTKPKPIDPTAYTPLLNLIAQAESNGNYNAYFGNAGNNARKFTDMSVSEVMAWQDEYVRQGSPSSAVGRYQIINKTLAGLVKQLGINPDQHKFDQALQDQMAVALLERRGAVEYMNNRISREQFAANLAKEWAALPKVIGDNPHQSFYAADGINKSRVAISQILKVLAQTSS